MQITVRGKNVEITGPLRDYVEKKVGKIEKYLEGPLSATVTLNVEKGRHIVEVTVPINGMLLRGEEATDDMYASIDLVVEKLEKQIDKYKTRLTRKLRPQIADEPAPKVFDDPVIVKTKRFAIKPMAVDEAVMQMNLIGHDFFVFADAETNQVNVVYRRRDGNYGLIEPDR